MTITSCTAQVLDAADPTDNAVLERLRADPAIEFLDHRKEQLEESAGFGRHPTRSWLPNPAGGRITPGGGPLWRCWLRGHFVRSDWTATGT